MIELSLELLYYLNEDYTMENDKKIEELFILAVAEVDNNKDFIISAITLMKTDEQRKKVLDYLLKNKIATKNDLKEKMAYISVGLA